ncbi:MAG: alpha-amylase family glycosyl hydrolase [Desulfuromonadales bacterium]
MPRPLDKKLLLNRQALNQLRQAGLHELADGITDIHVARKFAHWRGTSGAEVYLLTLLIAASRQVALHYFDQLNLQPGLSEINVAGAVHHLPELGRAYRDFLRCYPREELAKASEPGMSAAETLTRQRLLAEIFILEALTENPATRVFCDLFDDAELSARFDYHVLIKQLTNLPGQRHEQTAIGQSLPEFLRAPMRAAPHSLAEQIAYIARHWAPWLSESIVSEIQLARAITAEENRPHLPGPGPSPSFFFGKGAGSEAPAAFTADVDWMASSVLLAKSIYVWLDQLSSRYHRAITTLSDIPDEELACLAGWGFNALWLIGIWERSEASKRIKQLSGNPEAEASAYALYAYRIAEELGGESALQNLEHRCHNHGIRLACDVVPNHTGIDSEWVKHHPDWFLQADQPPYPAYSFSGPDLCNADAISIRIEDGYWDHRDAAVVYEYHDHRSGRRRYIYHGNDGTHMPWNDTAQLNFLLPEVRQAMSNLIVTIARRFSLIRFDAAMTLARKHFRRLWFPPPGGSAGVPSRSIFWMSDADFEEAFPVEFWREVVDRINREVPDTLLIAEAFWMMESYFVRNLGMHRVYNSAFMNLLKHEENAKYRKILKDILAYNPEILKRHVNFMNNPDEATAVEQFDKGDKYFGVATLLATLPGLPMFGHGQIEGYREKYGMEYRRAYWKETPDGGFISHHEQQIFPLLRIRQLFSGVENFSLYDFTTSYGINENVYAFSNGPVDRRVLVIYNNNQQQTQGRLHQASPKAAPQQEGVAHPMPHLWRALGLDHASGNFCRFRNLAGAKYLHQVEQLSHGLELDLDGYEHQVFHDFQLFHDTDGRWLKLCQRLQGRPVQNLDRELLQMLHEPLWQAFTKLLDPARLHVLAGGVTASPQPWPVKTLITELSEELFDFAAAMRSSTDFYGNGLSVSTPIEELFAALPAWLADLSAATYPGKLLANLWYGVRTQPGLGVALISWLVLQNLVKMLGFPDGTDGLECLRRFGLDYAWQESITSAEQEREVFLATLLMQTAAQTCHPATSEAAFAELCNDPVNTRLLGINSHADKTWFLQEGMTAVAGAIALQAEIMSLINGGKDGGAKAASSIAEILRQRLARAAGVGYRLDKFLSLD